MAFNKSLLSLFSIHKKVEPKIEHGIPRNVIYQYYKLVTGGHTSVTIYKNRFTSLGYILVNNNYYCSNREESSYYKLISMDTGEEFIQLKTYVDLTCEQHNIEIETIS